MPVCVWVISLSIVFPSSIHLLPILCFFADEQNSIINRDHIIHYHPPAKGHLGRFLDSTVTIRNE